MKKLYFLLPTVLVILAVYFLSRSISQDEIRIFVSQFGPYAPIIFILVTLPAYILAPLSGSPMLYAGYYIFGQKVILYSTIAAFISFAVNFWIARKWGRPIVEKLVGKLTPGDY